jgi:hypothetical protein
MRVNRKIDRDDALKLAHLAAVGEIHRLPSRTVSATSGSHSSACGNDSCRNAFGARTVSGAFWFPIGSH